MKIKLFVLITLAVFVTVMATSCVPWITRRIIEPVNLLFGNTEPDFVDSMEKVIVNIPDGADTAVLDTKAPGDTYVREIDTLFAELSADNDVFYFNNDSCALVYNDEGACIFDFPAEIVTPITGIDEMYAAADPTGRGRAYFDDYRMDIQASESETQLHLFFYVYSNTEDANFTVYAYYNLNGRIFSGTGIPDIKSHSLSGFYSAELNYPGCDEPFTVTSLDDYKKLGLYEDQFLLSCTRAFIENDVSSLEEYMGVEKGLLSVWEGVTVSDYTLTNPYPNLPGTTVLRMIATIEGSKMERYPDGQYIITISEGLGVEMEIVPVTASSDPGVMSDAESWVHTFASRFGGWYEADMLVPENSAFAHHLLDYFGHIKYQKGNEGALTGAEYREYSEKYFGFTDFENEYTVEGEINHGGHGGVGMICEIETVLSASGVHIIEVTYFADPMRSVVSLVKRFTASEIGDGEFRIDAIETVFETDHRVYGWST